MSDDTPGSGRPRLDQFTLVVSDMTASVDFYRLLGLDIPDTLPEWQARHRSAATDDGIDLDFDSVEFAQQWNRGQPGDVTRGPGVLGFKFGSRDAVDETYARLTAAGHRSQQPPYDAFWGARYAIVEDPDGNAVGLMSPIDAARTSAPPGP